MDSRLPLGWEWAGPWELDTDGLHEDGWDYAFNFSNYSEGRKRHPDRNGNCVRRRRWVRIRRPVDAEGDKTVEAGDAITLFFPNENNLYVRQNDGPWSKPVNVRAAGRSGVLVLRDSRHPTAIHALAVSVKQLSPPYHHSKLVTFHPRFWIMNDLPEFLFFRQAPAQLFSTDAASKSAKKEGAIPDGYSLAPQQGSGIQWDEPSLGPLLQIRPGLDAEWSQPFDASRLEVFPLAVPYRVGDTIALLRVAIAANPDVPGGIYIHVSYENLPSLSSASALPSSQMASEASDAEAIDDSPTDIELVSEPKSRPRSLSGSSLKSGISYSLKRRTRPLVMVVNMSDCVVRYKQDRNAVSTSSFVDTDQPMDPEEHSNREEGGGAGSGAGGGGGGSHAHSSLFDEHLDPKSKAGSALRVVKAPVEIVGWQLGPKQAATLGWQFPGESRSIHVSAKRVHEETFTEVSVCGW